jgi:hypothetical protein
LCKKRKSLKKELFLREMTNRVRCLSQKASFIFSAV